MRPRGHRLTLLAGVAALGLMTIGVLHTRLARPLLARFEFLCPVNRVSPETVERLQARAATELAGVTAVPSRAPFGLRVLSGRSDVGAWMNDHRLACEATTRGFAYVSCQHVPAAAIGRAGGDAARDREVVVARNRSGKIVGVDVLAKADGGYAADALTSQALGELRAALGEPDRLAGAFDAATLGTPFGNATLRYRYSDAVVIVSATNIPGSGVVVREQYLAAN